MEKVLAILNLFSQPIHIRVTKQMTTGDSFQMKTLFYKLPLVTCLVIGVVPQAALSNIPEPDIVFFGQVTAKVGSLDVPLRDGNLIWEIHPKERAQQVYRFETQLEDLSEGKYSYSLKIPQEILVDINTLMPQRENSLSIEDKKELFLKHYSINVNGEKALLKDESLSFFSSSQQNRAPYIQLDLEVSSKVLGDNLDANNNGIPDVWEQIYNISDINADDDGDGWSNAEEYKNNTNPLVNNKIPLLYSDSNIADKSTEGIQLELFENGWTQLRLMIQDSDSLESDITLTLGEVPDDIVIVRSNDLTLPLKAGEVLTASEVNAGGILVHHQPKQLLDDNQLPINPKSLEITISDNGPLHVVPNNEEGASEETVESEVNGPVVSSIHFSIIQIASISEPVRWIDGMVAKNSVVTRLQGRSAHDLDRVSTYAYEAENRRFIDVQKEIKVDGEGMISIPDNAFNEMMLAFPDPLKIDERLNLSGDRSLYFVTAKGEAPNTLFNDGSIEVKLKEYQISYAKNNSDQYVESPLSGKGEVLISAVHHENDKTQLSLNVIPVGGPNKHMLSEGEVIPSSALTGFGFATGAFGENDGFLEPFPEEVGEFIAFPSVLKGQEKWRVNAYLLSKWKNYVIHDASRATTPSHVEVSPHVNHPTLLLGGVTDDHLVGGKGDDILVGGEGSDVLMGGGGNDRFIVGDGDVVKDFTFKYSVTNSGDVLDVSELLIPGDQPLENCLFFEPQNDLTFVKVNTACEGKDTSLGTDFTDASFIVEGHALWDSDQLIIWSAGTLYTGSHKPGEKVAKLSIDGESALTIRENDGDEQRFEIEIEYEGGIPYQGDDLKIPLSLVTTAIPYEEFTLTMSRYVMPDDVEAIQKITGGDFQSFEELLALGDERLASFNLENTLNPDPNLSLIQHNYDLLENADVNADGSITLYVPAQLHSEKSIQLTLTTVADPFKESDDEITISLNDVPEYYQVSKDEGSIDVTITDGLDKVYVNNAAKTISEGQQGQFTLHRVGSIDQALLVDVSLSGLAENGEDYSTIPSQLTFPKGESILKVPVYVLSDSVSEPMELVELRVLSSDYYDVDATKNLAQLTIQDEALNFVDTDKDGLPDSWELAVGLNPNISNVLQDNAYKDSDSDGLSDQEEYRLGTDPMTADSDGDGITDQKDAAPLDAAVGDEGQLKGYQVVQAGRDKVFNVPLGMDRIIEIPLDYLTSDGSDKTSGLQLALQYNADQLEYLGVSQVLSKSHASTGSPFLKEVYRGGYKLFSHQVPITWDASGADWPSMPLPTTLLSARFKVLDSVTTVGQQFIVGIDADKAADGYGFKPSQVVVNVTEPSGLAILEEENGVDEAVMLARHLAGLSPELPDAGDDSTESKLTPIDIERIQQHISEAGLQYDVDGDGVVNPLSDAVLIYHYLQYGELKVEQVKRILGEGSEITVDEVTARILEILGGQQ